LKIDTARTDSFLKNPSANVILLYGPDSGLVAERGLTLARSIPGAAADPFRFAELHGPDPATFLSEATAASLTGGQRVIRVRDAGEALTKPLESLLNNPPDALIILEAGELTAKSKLRALAEIDADRLPKIFTDRLRAAGITLDPDAAAWLAKNIAGAEGPVGQAVEFLALYAGDTNRLTLEDVRAALPDGGDTSMQDAVDATLTGDPAATDRALTLAYDEGVSPVGILRVLLGELMRLRLAAASGLPAAQAVAAMRPPVFYKRAPTVTRALSLWTPNALMDAIRIALTAEAACKTTAIPDQSYCRQMMLNLASRARRQR
jgi:DNA polymerase-3 subunit delta